MGAKRPFWSFIILAAAAVLLLNALAGSSSSPLPRLLHIARVPGWWPLVLAVVTGVALGGIFNRGRSGQPAPGGTGGKPASPVTRGRHAVPRHVRRAREREALRRERVEKVQAAALATEEAARREQEAAAAPPAPPSPRGALDRVRTMLRRGVGGR